MYYLGRGLLGKGLAVNLSLKGWRVRGDQSVRPGQWLAFRLHLADAETPIEIPRAIVRWTEGKEFGVEWLVAERPAEEELRGFVHEMAARL